MRFLYWDDLGDSQGEVDNQSEAEKRMMVIMQNGNSGEHYFNYYNEHPSAAEIWDDGEEQDVE